jgi:hypothetical protein
MALQILDNFPLDVARWRFEHRSPEPAPPGSIATSHSGSAQRFNARGQRCHGDLPSTDGAHYRGRCLKDVMAITRKRFYRRAGATSPPRRALSFLSAVFDHAVRGRGRLRSQRAQDRCRGRRARRSRCRARQSAHAVTMHRILLAAENCHLATVRRDLRRNRFLHFFRRFLEWLPGATLL